MKRFSAECLLLSAALVLAFATSGSAFATDRLMWSPRDFLAKGYRTIPWSRNPFFPEDKQFRLTGIISNELAYINGQWLAVGDRVAGYLVESILPNEVVLAGTGKTVRLKVRDYE